MRAAVFDREYRTADVEDGDIDPAQLDQLPAAGRDVIERTGFEPLWGHKLMKRCMVNEKRLKAE